MIPTEFVKIPLKTPYGPPLQAARPGQPPDFQSTPYGPPPSAAHEFPPHFHTPHPYGPDTGRPDAPSNFLTRRPQKGCGSAAIEMDGPPKEAAPTTYNEKPVVNGGRAAREGGPYGV